LTQRGLLCLGFNKIKLIRGVYDEKGNFIYSSWPFLTGYMLMPRARLKAAGKILAKSRSAAPSSALP
jgi:hypothetical protein